MLPVLATILGLLVTALCGVVALSLGENRASGMSRLERLGIGLSLALAMGMLIESTGWHPSDFGRSSISPIVVMLLALLVLTFVEVANGPRPVVPTTPANWCAPIAGWLGGAVAAVAVVGLLAWAVTMGAGGAFLDYDSTAVWGLRLDAVVRDVRTGGDTFTNPNRLAPMLRHPYFYTSLERGFVPGSVPSQSPARSVPLVALYLSYLAVAWGAAGWLPGRRRRLLAVTALLFLPAASLHLGVESPRETVMGFLGFLSVYCLARSATEDRVAWAGLAVLFALAMQQTKVEGFPFLVGALVAIAALGMRRSGLRSPTLWKVVGPVLAAVVVANLLWLQTRSKIPVTRHSYDVTTALATDIPARLRALPGVVWMLVSEMFLRPEIYGLTAFITAGALFTGWRRGDRLARFSLLLPSLLCIAGLIAVYAARQSYLPSERNVSFSRRIIVFLPALAFAALYVPPRREEDASAETAASAPQPDPVSS